MHLWLDCNGALGTHGCSCVLFLFVRSISKFFYSSNLFCGRFVTCMHWSCAFLPTEARWSTTKDGLLLVGSPRRSFGYSHAFVITEYEMCVISMHPWLLMHRLILQPFPMVLTHFWTTTTQYGKIVLTMEKTYPYLPHLTQLRTFHNWIDYCALTGLIVSVIPFTSLWLIFYMILPLHDFQVSIIV